MSQFLQVYSELIENGEDSTLNQALANFKSSDNLRSEKEEHQTYLRKSGQIEPPASWAADHNFGKVSIRPKSERKLPF